MRVLMIANTLPPHDLSGAGEQVVQLAAGLESLGHQVEILGRGPGGARGPKLLFPLTVVWPALRTIRRLRPDVVQIHESDGGLVAVAMRVVARVLPTWLPACRLVALQQVSYLEEIRAVRPLLDLDRELVVARPVAAEIRFKWLRAPLQLLLGRWTARLSDLVLAPSRRTGDELERDYGVRNVAKLPNATSLEDPGALPRRGPLLFVGRFRIRKGIEVLLHALVAAEPAIELQIVGDGERRRSIADLIERLGLDDRVWLLGRRSPAEVRRLLTEARALVVPSTYEGMPLVVLEAMSVGCPVIASRVSGIPEVIEDGKSGWLVAPERVGELAAALVEAWSSAEQCARRGECARISQRQQFHPSRAAAVWSELLATAGNPAAADRAMLEEPR